MHYNRNLIWPICKYSLQGGMAQNNNSVDWGEKGQIQLFVLIKKAQRKRVLVAKTQRHRESKTKKKEREKNESNNIPAQCSVLCKLWESCSLAWERASAGL